jgi:hypothetical protein
VSHAAEFQNMEAAAGSSVAYLLEKHWPGGSQLDRDSHDRHQRQRGHQQQHGSDDVNQSFSA